MAYRGALGEPLPQTLGQPLPETLGQTLAESLPQALGQSLAQTLRQPLPQTLAQRVAQTLGQPGCLDFQPASCQIQSVFTDWLRRRTHEPLPTFLTPWPDSA